MPRHTAFSSPGRAPPFAGHDSIRLDPVSVRGALPFFNPTHARFHMADQTQTNVELTDDKQPSTTQTVAGAVMNWRSRDNRKGRHALRLDPSVPASTTSSLRAVGRGLLRMCTECPYWDISYLVAVSFSVGCLLFILCGLFYWLPIVAPRSTFPQETIAGGATAFAGATLFQIGAILLIFEAVNEHQTGCFGWALQQAFTGDEGESGGIVKHCHHHHRHDRSSDPSKQPQPDRKWTWWPSWQELKTHYIHQIGFVASITLAIGATVFYICGICTIPPIYNHMSLGAIQGVYYLTYLVGGVIFVISSLLYMLENQTAWYIPAPHLLGWHIGLWNLIGSVGWTLAASFGYCIQGWCIYQSNLTLIWASTSFLIGSMLQWYEALNKYPIEKSR